MARRRLLVGPPGPLGRDFDHTAPARSVERKLIHFVASLRQVRAVLFHIHLAGFAQQVEHIFDTVAISCGSQFIGKGLDREGMVDV